MKQFLFILCLVPALSWAQEEPVVKPQPVAVPEQEPEIYNVVDEPAEFPGGITALKKYLADNIRYPKEAIELGIQGRCYVQFIVSTQGTISNVKVVRGVADCPACDKETVRVVKAMPKWAPAKNNGKAVNSYFSLPVAFKLPEPVKEPAKK